jgi:hypothetical protein
VLGNRPIAVIVLTRTAAIVGGFFAIRFFTLPPTIAKPEVLRRLRYGWSARFLRAYGWKLIAIPAARVAYAYAARRIDAGLLSAAAAFYFGVSLSDLLALWYLITAFCAGLQIY